MFKECVDKDDSHIDKVTKVLRILYNLLYISTNVITPQLVQVIDNMDNSEYMKTLVNGHMKSVSKTPDVDKRSQFMKIYFCKMEL